VMFHVPLDTRMELCTREDTAYALVQAIDCDGVNGGIFNLGGGENCRIVYRDLLERMLAEFGLPVQVLPENAFAIHNFNCGYLDDSHELNDLLGFQRHSIDDLMKEVAVVNDGPLKAISKKMPPALVRMFMANMSPCLKAVRKKDQHGIKRFYKSLDDFKQIPNRPVSTSVPG
jgi:hypothetical protein